MAQLKIYTKGMTTNEELRKKKKNSPLKHLFMNTYFKSIAVILTSTIIVLTACNHSENQEKTKEQNDASLFPDMMVRISEIEILPEYLQQYNAILKEEAAASVKLEPGVISIFPMYVRENPTQIRILEIYANKASYQSHLKTPHFQHYKTNTLKMVKSLKLVDMTSIDKETMLEIFKKMN